MTTTQRTATRHLAWLAGVLVGILTIAVPAGYFLLSYKYAAGHLESEVEINARLISQIIGANPDLWRFEGVRIQDILSRRPHNGFAEVRRIVDAHGERVAESTDAPSPPLLVRSAALFDAGNVVGRIEVARSLRSVFARTGLIFLFMLLLSAEALWILCLLPIRLILRSEEALRESEERFRTLFHGANDAVFVHGVDSDGIPTRFLEINQVACSRLGYTREEFLELTPADIEAAVEKGLRPMTSLLRTGCSITQTMQVAKDGREIPVETSSRLFDWRGRKLVLAISRDITDRKKAETAVSRIRRMESLGALAGGIAHHFNNILAVIQGNVSLLRSEIETGGAQELIEEANDACRVAAGLAQQLLTFAKGASPLRKRFDLRPLLQEASRLAAEGSDTRCVFELGGNPLPAEINKEQISGVIQNLVINAVQAMPEGGCLTVRAALVRLHDGEVPPLTAGRYIEVRFEDQGAGIPEAHLPRVFEPYFSTKEFGRGLGLTMADAIMSKHGGHITVENRPGLGAAFILLFRAAEEPDSASAGGPPAIAEVGGNKVLVMDDEASSARILKRMLERLGYQAESVSDGQAVLDCHRAAMAAGCPYTAVIMDLSIPGGTGCLETIRGLKTLDPRVKAIATIGYPDDSPLSDCSAHGFSAVLKKPYAIEEVSEALRQSIGPS